MAKTKIALLYERLSRDDELSGESFSIQNQKIMLEDFARRNGYLRFRHYTDDGVSGTRFDRPGFMAMMEEVEDGGVEAIIVKDMSRLGRDYLKVGQVMEILRQRGVRLIAINDNVDTDRGDNDMTPFLNIMYEFYARDTSRKIKSVFKAKGMSGKHLTGFVPYGYLWDEKRENWIVDGEAADVVRRIYAMTLEGYGPFQIASRLTADKIEMPAVHMARHGEGLHKTRDIKDPCQWSTSTVVNILKRREYLGHTVNFKTRKHFKDKKSHYVDENEWTIFEHTHEALIHIFLKNQLDDFRILRLYNKIPHILIFLVHPACFLQPVAKRCAPAGVKPLLSQLFQPGLDAQGSFNALSRSLPIADVIQQLIHVIVKPLLALHGAPYFNILLDKPFHHKGRFIVLAAQPVEHKHQQNIKFALQGHLLYLLNRVPVPGGDLKPGNAFFRKFLGNLPAGVLPAKSPARLLLHGNIVFVNLSYGRHPI